MTTCRASHIMTLILAAVSSAAPAFAQPAPEPAGDTPTPPEAPPMDVGGDAVPAPVAPSAQPEPPPGFIDPTPYTVTQTDEDDDERDMHVLVHGPIESGGMGGVSVLGSRVYGHDALFVGGRGGWIANHVFVLGGGGYGLVTSIDPPPGAAPSATGYELSFGYGGLWLEGIILPGKVVHGTVGALVGAGGVGTMRHHDGGGGTTTDQASDTVFVAEPTVALEVSITHFMRLDATASYRLVRDVDMVGLTNSDLSGFAFGGMLKFGKF